MQGYIYHIINKKNGKRYIGKTINLKHRLECHYSKLRNNKHHSHKLQRAFNKYGADSFKVEWKKVEVENDEELSLLEIEEIAKYNSYYDGYNETFGGDGGKTALDFEDSVLVYHICQNYQGVNRQIARYFNCDHTVISIIAKNELFTNVEYNRTDYENLIQKIGIKDSNSNENYVPHNKEKLNEQQCLEILSVITQTEKYEKTICAIFNINSKLTWRLKRGLIYKEYFEEFNRMSPEEKQLLCEKTLNKYNIKNEYAKRQRNCVKNALAQEQVNYILDNKESKTRTQISRDLNVQY